MLEVVRLLFATVLAWVRPRQDLVLENLLFAPSTRRPDPSCSHPTTCSAWHLGQAAVDPGSPRVRWLARASVLRYTQHGRALAYTRLAFVLALEVPLSRRTSSSESRGAEPDHDYVSRKPTVGHRAHQR